MPYEIELNVTEIAKTTLYLLEHTKYPGHDGMGKNAKPVKNLKDCLQSFLTDFDAEISA